MCGVRFDNVADSWVRTSGMLNYNAAYTMMFWVYLVSDLNAFSTFYQSSVGNYPHADWIGTDSDGVTLQLYNQAGGGAITDNGSVLSTGTWYHIALVRNGTATMDAYLNGVLDASVSLDVSSRNAITEMRFGSINGADRGDMRIAYVKAWSTNLTASEVQAEMHAIHPQQFTNLYGWWPCWTGSSERYKDYSGNGRNWTEAGTLTEENPPPVSYGAPHSYSDSTLAPQLGTAISDVSDGSWTDQGGGTSLYSAIDETPYSDSDYIRSSESPSADICEVRLTAVSDPVSSSGHVFRYRYGKDLPNGKQMNLVVRLREGASTTIVTWTHNNIASGFIEAEQILSGGEADSISNYGDLRLRFEATQD